MKKTAPTGNTANKPKKKRLASALFVFMERFRKQVKFKEEKNAAINFVAAEKAPFVAKAEQRKTTEISSVESVISNDDLLTKILLKLPVLSLFLFKSVSKKWLSLIKDANAISRLSQFPNFDPVFGLFLKKVSYKKYIESLSYDFVPLDIRIPICRSSLLATNFTFGLNVHGDCEILHSCNGLFLCRIYGKLYVYNPSVTNMFKGLPEPDNVTYYHNALTGGLGMAFDPTKSPHYKVIYAEIVEVDHPLDKWVQIHTYSSKTGNWSLCGNQFTQRCFLGFQDGVYWNDAFYWIGGVVHRDAFFKLDIMNDNPVLTALPTPLTLDGKVHNHYSLFVSRGCLLLVDMLDYFSQHFTIFEKGSVYSEWSVKYIVNLDARRWSIYEKIFCIVLGEREEDSFLVWRLGRKVVQHKIVSKTRNTIFDLGPNETLRSCFQFIPSFANV